MSGKIIIAYADGNGKIQASQSFSEFQRGSRNIEIVNGMYGRKLFDIFVDELGYIRYEDNKIAWNYIFRNDIQTTVMLILGKVAEAVIVRRCKELPYINQVWLTCARRARRLLSLRESQPYTAIGTGLLSTKNKHPRLYSYTDEQRDIEWIDSNENPVLVVHGPRNARVTAGLQVKASTDGCSYVYPELINHRYVVPLVYFGVGISNDYDKVAMKLYRNNVISNDKIGIDFINANALDPDAYYEVRYYSDLVHAVVDGRLSPEQLLDQADNLPNLKTAISSASIDQLNLSQSIIY